MSTVRHSGFDNLKGILIILVVIGHNLELCSSNSITEALYLVIYSFHMPAFIFISGYYAKYSRRHLYQLTILYGAFQILYSMFDHYVLKNPYALTPSRLLFTPYWLLWYLFIMIYCHLLLPLWIRQSHCGKTVILGLSIFTSLLCGYCPLIGYPMSLSRFLVFLPYYLAGNLTGANHPKPPRLNPALPAALVLVLSLYLCQSCRFTRQMLYGSYSYSIGYHPGIRLQLMIIAAVWIWFFLALSGSLLNKRIPFLSYIGAHTLPIYLLHGFAVKITGRLLPSPSISGALLLSFITVTLLGNPAVIRLFDWVQKPLRKK